MAKLIVGLILGFIAAFVAMCVIMVNETHPEPFEPKDEWDGRNL